METRSSWQYLRAVHPAAHAFDLLGILLNFGHILAEGLGQTIKIVRIVDHRPTAGLVQVFTAHIPAEWHRGG